jgi:hypothetical protein
MLNLNRYGEYEPDMAHVMTPFDVWAFVMGWLWTGHGLTMVLGCLVGVVAGTREIAASLTARTRVATDPAQVRTFAPGDVVAVTGRIVADEVCDFMPRATSGSFSLAVLDGSDRRVLVLRPGVLSQVERMGVAAESYRGRLLRVGDGTVSDGTHRADARRAFRAIGIDLPEDAVVIADGSERALPWWLWVVMAVLIAGLVHLGHRIVEAVRCIRDRNRLFDRIDAQWRRRDH